MHGAQCSRVFHSFRPEKWGMWAATAAADAKSHEAASKVFEVYARTHTHTLV